MKLVTRMKVVVDAKACARPRVRATLRVLPLDSARG